MWVNVPGPEVRPLGKLRSAFFDGAASYTTIFLKTSLRGRHRTDTLRHELLHHQFNRAHPAVYFLLLHDVPYWSSVILFAVTGFLPLLLPFAVNMVHELSVHRQTGTPKRCLLYFMVDGAILCSLVMLSSRIGGWL